MLVLVWSVLCSLVKWFGVSFFLRLFDCTICECPYGGAVVPTFFALLCGVISWAIARRLGLSLRMSASSALLIALLIFAVVACVYVGWVRYRVVYRLSDFVTPVALPHPDAAATEIYDWLEARNPTPPGSFKYHGEWPAVRFTLDILIVTLAGITGGCLGLVAPGLFPGDYLKRIIGWNNMKCRVTLGRRTRRMLVLALVAGAAWSLLKMEQTRSQWKDAAEWAEMGASASYRKGQLVGLRFNVLTLSMHYFGNGQLGDDDLMQLTDLIDLEELGLTDTQITDAGLVCLKGLTKLSHLTLEDTQITDAGLVHLEDLTKLEWLTPKPVPLTALR